MTTRKGPPKTRRARKKQQTRAASTATPEIDQNVDSSPAAVEARREGQSGPGATGVAHTGEGPATPGAGAAPPEGHLAATTDDEDVRAGARELAEKDEPVRDESNEPTSTEEPAEIEERLRPPQEKHGH